MSVQRVPSPRRLTDPRTMRALSHPVRLALLEALALHGDLTATQAAHLIEETPTTCSFHLRQLAKYGFIEEVGGGVGRSRPWRALEVGFSLDLDSEDPAAEVAGERLAEMTLRRQLDRHAAWRSDWRGLPEQWRRIGGSTETVWWVTPQEAAELDAEITNLSMRFRDRLLNPARRPAGAAAVEVIVLTHVLTLDQDQNPSNGDNSPETTGHVDRNNYRDDENNGP